MVWQGNNQGDPSFIPGLHQGAENLAKGAADDDADSHVHNVAAHGNFFEFLQYLHMCSCVGRDRGYLSRWKTSSFSVAKPSSRAWATSWAKVSGATEGVRARIQRNFRSGVPTSTV